VPNEPPSPRKQHCSTCEAPSRAKHRIRGDCAVICGSPCVRYRTEILRNLCPFLSMIGDSREGLIGTPQLPRGRYRNAGSVREDLLGSPPFCTICRKLGDTEGFLFCETFPLGIPGAIHPWGCMLRELRRSANGVGFEPKSGMEEIARRWADLSKVQSQAHHICSH
jgi:hypothetical protein